ncbi:unnamed protein product, partial [Rotaria socialis]
VPLDKADRPKTAFSTRDGHFQFKVLPQGLTNGPPTFQRIVNQILGPNRWKNVLAYIDDIIIYSKNFSEHIRHIEEVCALLHESNFKLNVDKCEIARTEILFLGHAIKAGTIKPDPDNIRGLTETREPTSAEEAFRFVKAAECLPDDTLSFKLQTDACVDGIGAVLPQVTPDEDRPLVFMSKKLTKTQTNWPPIEQECYAIVQAIDKWDKYLR